MTLLVNINKGCLRMGKNLKVTDRFNFMCHENLDCFKKCCKDINIFLTPYDVLRLKNKMGLASSEFLKKYTHVFSAPNSGFPLVIIKMREDSLVCPFITDYGCQVYHVRPWSCRMAPVEVRGDGIYGIAFEKNHCHGLNESKEWTVKEWIENQGLEEYNEPEKLFGQIPLNIKLTGKKDIDQTIMQMIFAGCYDLDRFRKILLENPSLVDGLSDEAIRKISEDDLELMKLAFEWLPINVNNIDKVKKLKDIFDK